MDALSDLLRTAKLAGGVFLHAEFTMPWCLLSTITPESCSPYLAKNVDLITYHYVLEGELKVRLETGEQEIFHSGELALLPRNEKHFLGGDFSTKPVLASEVIRSPKGQFPTKIRIAGGGSKTKIACGYLAGEELKKHPLVNGLPSLMRLDTKDCRYAVTLETFSLDSPDWGFGDVHE